MKNRFEAGVVWCLALIMLVAVGIRPAAGEEAPEIGGDSVAAQTYQISADDMWLQYELWLAAIKAGDPELIDEYESILKGMINADIASCQTQVHELAQAVVLNADSNSVSAKTQGDNKQAADSAEAKAAREAFREKLAALNTKEALCLALDKTDNFNHKYRLLGDYINLLRRELNMPKAQWAASEKQSTSSSGNYPVVSPGP